MHTTRPGKGRHPPRARVYRMFSGTAFRSRVGRPPALGQLPAWAVLGTGGQSRLLDGKQIISGKRQGEKNFRISVDTEGGF